MATFTFDRITPDGKIVIKVDENIHELTEEQVRKSFKKLADKYKNNGGLDTLETAWAREYKKALDEFDKQPRLNFAG